MKKIFNKKLILIVFCMCMMPISMYSQLALVSDHEIDFTSAVSTISSGNWSNPNIWSNGIVPAASTDVIIEDGHTVYIDVQGSVSGEIVDICRNINIKTFAVLRMGHDTPNFSKDLRVNGSILCNGTFSSGRNQPDSSGDGSIYDFNSRIYLVLNQDNTYVSGAGYFNPRALSISSPVANRNLIIDHYNIVIDKNFAIKSDYRVNTTLKYYAYMYVKETIGLTGSTYQYSSPTAKSDLTIEGLVVANNVSLFTKNTSSGESSSITIKAKGSLFVKAINQGNLNVISEAAGFNLSIEEDGLLRLDQGIDFNNLIQGNSNFSFSNSGELRAHYSNTMSSTSQITASINANDPNQGVDVSQIQDIFGSSHIAGWYNFTDRPYLLEGLDYYKNFGATSVKTTLTATNGSMFKAYPFNHTWSNFQTIKEVAQHEMIDSLFLRSHIKTHTFWTTTKNKGDWKQGPDFLNDSYVNEEQQFYDLTKHLLQTYGDMEKTFVYQNWEGDWMLRGQGVQWENDPSLIPDDLQWLTAGMSRMFRARQRGTERARNEFPDATAKVYHAIEFNKLWLNVSNQRILTMANGTPSVLENVIPHSRLDLSSWSAYDASWTNGANPQGHAMWKGLEVAKYYTTETGATPFDFPIQIGEFGINENPPYNGSNSESVIRNRYGRYIGVALGLGVPNFYLWNLYGSGQQGGPAGFQWEKDVQYETSFLYQWLDGKWLLEPDGSWGYAASFLMEQWANALSDDDLQWDKNQYLNVYPNPTDDYISISNVIENVKISIFDCNGRFLKQLNYSPGSKLYIGDLSAGTYLLTVYSKNSPVTTKKILIH